MVRILALRGYITLLRIRSDRPVQQSIDLFTSAMALATQTTEKTMVLAGLGALQSAEALNATVRYLDDPSVQREAEAAILRILGRIRRADEERTLQMLNGGLRESLNKVLEVSNDPELRALAAEVLAKGARRYPG